jgi:type VI secretion system protein ImpF
MAASSLDITDLTRAIREAILTFEPRILPATLEIKTLLEAGELDHHNVIGVEIHGQLWAQPVPMEFLVRTDFDLETGKVRITDLISAPRVA